MNAVSALLLSLTLFFSSLSYAQVVEEKSVDFTPSPLVVTSGKIHIAYEWITPADFSKTRLSLMDLPKIGASHIGNNQMIISKMAFIAKNSFDGMSYQSMNTAEYITKMLDSVAITQKASDFWNVTNKVKAYNIPFRVSFDFKFREVTGESLGANLLNYIKDEAAVVKSSGRERFLVLDMTNFTQLVYRNYSVVYMREISPTQTLVFAGVVAAIDINKANSYFNYPPFATTKGTMMSNLKTQIIQMAKTVQQ